MKIVMPINEEEYKRDCQKCYQQGREARETEIIRIIENLKESAESQMMDKCVYACDRILEEIKLNEKS